MSYALDPAPGSKRRWAMFITGSLGFVLSMFYRVSTAIISPDLARELSLSGAELGKLSAAFFYAFALSQIPLGLALERWGIRRVVVVLTVLSVSGALLFAGGHSLNALVLARVLLGAGMSGALMAMLALLAAWFPVDRFAFLGGLVISIGTLGNLLAATPLALLAAQFGWRGTFMLFAAANALISLVFFLVLRDRPPQSRPPEPMGWRELLAGLGAIARTYNYWAIALSNFVRYGYFAALQGLWAGPFLIYGLGLDEIDTGNAILAMGLGCMIGLPINGRLSDYYLRTRKWVILPNLIIFTLLVLSVVLWDKDAPLEMVLGTFFLFGFVAAPGQISFAHMKELLPPEMVSRALTMVNIFPALGAAAITHGFGLVLAGDPSQMTNPADYSMLWYLGAAGLALVSLLYCWVPDSKAMRQG